MADPINVKVQNAHLAGDTNAVRNCIAELEALWDSRLNRIQVYREKDVEGITRSLKTVSDRLVEFHTLLGWDRVSKAKGDELAHELATKPEVANLIAAQPKSQKDLLQDIAPPGPEMPEPARGR